MLSPIPWKKRQHLLHSVILSILRIPIMRYVLALRTLVVLNVGRLASFLRICSGQMKTRQSLLEQYVLSFLSHSSFFSK
jgi:hypothetical protein